MLLTGRTKSSNIKFSKVIEDDTRLKSFFEYVVDWPSVNAPQWMQDIVVQECGELKIKPPHTISTKYIDSHPVAGWSDGVGGYTVHGVLGEICIVYEVGKYFGTPQEKNTLLHELSHWIVKEYEDDFGGHTPRFYKEYTRLVLKHGGDLELFLFDEYPTEYGGDNFMLGIELFEDTYNRG